MVSNRATMELAAFDAKKSRRRPAAWSGL